MACYDPDEHDSYDDDHFENGVAKDHDTDKTKRWFLAGVCLAIAIIITWAVA